MDRDLFLYVASFSIFPQSLVDLFSLNILLILPAMPYAHDMKSLENQKLIFSVDTDNRKIIIYLQTGLKIALFYKKCI